MTIPHSKPTVEPDDIQAVMETLSSGRLSNGLVVEKLELGLTNLIGRPVACVGSGTMALHLAFLSLDLPPGSKVAIPTHTCPSMLYALNYVQAKPVLYDCGPLGVGLNPDSFEKAVRQSRAAVIVHSFGYPVTDFPIKSLEIPWIEDCAHSLGAIMGQLPTGCLGSSSVFSFYPTKMVAGIEGGCIAADRDTIEHVKKIRTTHHADDRTIRYPYEMSDPCAAIVSSQILKLQSFIDARLKRTEFYRSELQGLPVKWIHSEPGTVPSYYRFIVETSEPREIIREAAFSRGIQLGCGVRTPLHRILDLQLQNFPHSEHAYKFSVSLPLYPSLSFEDCRQVTDFFWDFFENRK